jgi:hypothetical protein
MSISRRIFLGTSVAFAATAVRADEEVPAAIRHAGEDLK